MPYKDKETRRAHYAKNRDRILAQQAAWSSGRKPQKAAYDAEYRCKNQIKIAKRRHAHYTKNKARLVAKSGMYLRVYREELRDSYVRVRLGIRHGESPKSLLELKRAQLMGLRMLKEKTK